MYQVLDKTDNFEFGNFYFFGLNLGKLPNYVQYFGSNNVEGVAESWVEAEMSWVDQNIKILIKENNEICLYILLPQLQ